MGAPTPTDELLTTPARLVGTFPVDDTRRHLAAGPLLDWLLEQSVTSYVQLCHAIPPPDRLDMVPANGFPLSRVDASLREEIVRRLRTEMLLLDAGGHATTPADAVVIPGMSREAASLLAEALPGLLHTRPDQLDALRMLGSRQLALADATTALAELDREPTFWNAIYRALADYEVEDLANLPVPLVGGGRRIGPRGCLLPGPGIDPELRERAGVLAPRIPIVDPVAAHPLLERLGAQPVDAATLLTEPSLVAVYREFRDELEIGDPEIEDVDEMARLALDLLAAAGNSAGSPSIVDFLVLTDTDGQAWPAAELLLPNAPIAALLAPDADLPTVEDRWTRAHPADLLIAAGLRTGLRIVTVDPADTDPDLPDFERWWERGGEELSRGESFTAIADLDLVDDRAWPEVFAMIAADRDARDTLGPAGNYTGWWLSEFAQIDGLPLRHWRLPSATGLIGLYDEVSPDIDQGVAAAAGVLAGLDGAITGDPAGLLARYGDPARQIPAAAVAGLNETMVRLLADRPDLPLPERVRVVTGAAVPAPDAVVVDRPWLAAVLSPETMVMGAPDPELTADTLEVELASEYLAGLGLRLGPPSASALPAGMVLRATSALVAAAREAGRVLPLGCDPDLRVIFDAGDPVRVPWWPGEDGSCWVDGSAPGVGRAVAWLLRRWDDRHVAVAAAAQDWTALAEG